MRLHKSMTTQLHKDVRGRQSAPPAREAESVVTVPFTHTLGKNDKCNETYLQIDANGDGRCFSFMSTYAVCQGPNTDAFDTADDWFVSPAVSLEGGKTYNVSFQASGSTDVAKAATWALYYGTERSVEGLTNVISAPAVYAGKNFATVETQITVAEGGLYYFGFHCTSPKTSTTLSRIKDLSVSEAAPMVDAPAAGALSWTLAPQGELSATVSYTTPTLTQSGAPLTEISKVEIWNWTNPNAKTVLTDVQPGQTYTATFATLQGSNNRFFAVSYTGETAGDEVNSGPVYAGLDTPLAPQNVAVTLSDDYKHVTLSWDAVPETGENGGYVNPANVTYYVFDAFGSYYDPAIAQTTETSVTFDYSDLTEQDFVAYQVTAGQDYYYSLETSSDMVVVGTPDNLPWHESFSDAYYGQSWAIEPGSDTSMMTGIVYDDELQTNADNPDAEPQYLNSHDGDNGFFYIMPMDVDQRFGFYSTKISLTGATRPVFEFWYQGKGSALDALLSVDGGAFADARVIDLQQSPTDDWTLCRIDLTPYLSSRYVQVGLRMRAIHNDEEHTWSVPLDNMRIIDLADCDLRVSWIKAPASLTPGMAATAKVSVENMGTLPAQDVVVTLNKGVVSSSLNGDIAAGQVVSFTFDIAADALDDDSVTLTAAVDHNSDSCATNNTMSRDIEVKHTLLPMVTDITSQNDGDTVSLSWTEPAYTHLAQPVEMEDGFESADYEPLTIYNFGDWIMVDADRLQTYGLLDDYNPYTYARMAFQIYNADAAGLADDQRIDMLPHSGQNLLYAPSARGLNDNWLISPLLSGEAQTISFWARSFTDAYPESFQVLYSDGSTSTTDFVQVTEVTNYPDNDQVSEIWTQYSALLPAGTLRFAVRHTADDTYALLLDDFTYTAAAPYPGIQLTGYTIYRNGTPTTTTDTTSHSEQPESSGQYTYRVAANYSCGQARASLPHVVDFLRTVPVGVADLTDAPADAPVFNLQGIAVDRDNIPAGIYIIDGKKYVKH